MTAAVAALAAWAGPATPARAEKHASACVVSAATITSTDGTAIVSGTLDVTPVSISYTVTCDNVTAGGPTLTTSSGTLAYTIVGNCAAAVAVSANPDTVSTVTDASVWAGVLLGWNDAYNQSVLVFRNMCDKTSSSLALAGVAAGVTTG